MFRAIAKSRYIVPGFLCFVLAFVPSDGDICPRLGERQGHRLADASVRASDKRGLTRQ